MRHFVRFALPLALAGIVALGVLASGHHAPHLSTHDEGASSTIAVDWGWQAEHVFGAGDDAIAIGRHGARVDTVRVIDGKLFPAGHFLVLQDGRRYRLHDAWVPPAATEYVLIVGRRVGVER